MRIAIATYFLAMGGVETVIFNQVKYFESQGHEITVFETYRKGGWRKFFKENNINVESIIPNPIFSKHYHAERLAKRLRGFDAILIHDAPFAQSVLKKLRPETVILPVLHNNYQSMLENASGNYGQWNKIIAVSPYLQELLLEKIGFLKAADVECIPNGIALPPPGLTRTAEQFRKPFSIAYIGRISHSDKGILHIPDIISQLLKRTDAIGEVHIYGDGPDTELLKKEITKQNLDNVIHYKGKLPHDEVFKTLAHHDFLLMPSYIEGHPIVLLEAMACGVIPLVSNLPGRTDIIVQHSENGFLCEPGNIEDFVEKATEAFTRNDLEEIALKARDTIRERFSVEAMGHQYLDIIEKEALKEKSFKRDGIIDQALLGDLANVSVVLVRPIRKFLKLTGLWQK